MNVDKKTNSGTKVLIPQLLRFACIRPKCEEKHGSLDHKKK